MKAKIPRPKSYRAKETLKKNLGVKISKKVTKTKNTGKKSPVTKKTGVALKSRRNCLSDLTFVVTGKLSSYDRPDCIKFIGQLGGRVTAAVSPKTNFLIVGDKPGQVKLEKATLLGIPQLDEDKFFKLVHRLKTSSF